MKQLGSIDIFSRVTLGIILLAGSFFLLASPILFAACNATALYLLNTAMVRWDPLYQMIFSISVHDFLPTSKTHSTSRV